MLVGLLFWLALAPISLAPQVSANVWSRYMAIESMVERGTLQVDNSPLWHRHRSSDVVCFGGKFYSGKPPVLAALGAVVYVPLAMAGFLLSGDFRQFVVANFVLVWTISGLGSALAVVGIRSLLQLTTLPKWVADLLALGGGAGTLLLSYSVTFNNHTLAAGLITVAYATTVFEGPKRRHQVLAGLFAGLAAVIDVPAGGLTLAIVGAWWTYRDRSAFWFVALGAIGPLVLHSMLQTPITGSPLPSELYPESSEFPGSYWLTEEGRWVERGPRWWFALEFLVGPQGWLTMTPVLAIGLGALPWFVRRGQGPIRQAAIALSMTVLGLVVYYVWVVHRTDFAGHSFGTRHMLPVTPLLFFVAVLAIDRARQPLLTVIFAAFFLVGLAYAVIGAIEPWKRVENRNEQLLRVLQKAVIYPHTSFWPTAARTSGTSTPNAK